MLTDSAPHCKKLHCQYNEATHSPDGKLAKDRKTSKRKIKEDTRLTERPRIIKRDNVGEISLVLHIYSVGSMNHSTRRY